MKIGVFDSGLGGKYVAQRLADIFPDDQIIYANDRDNLPYGDKTAAQLRQLTAVAIQPLLDADCQAIVIACNSATTNAIDWLRQKFPDTFFVGIEPMIKPASQLTKTGKIAICATPATLASSNYADLKLKYASGIEVVEPDCSSWATLIENNQADLIDVETTAMQLGDQGCDVIVLGCTHYHYLKNRFQASLPTAIILEPTDAIAERIASQLIKAR